MGAVSRVLMTLQEQLPMDPETAGLPSGRGREDRTGAKPTPETPALSVQVPSPVLTSGTQQVSVELKCMIFSFIGVLSTE